MFAVYTANNNIKWKEKREKGEENSFSAFHLSSVEISPALCLWLPGFFFGGKANKEENYVSLTGSH